jgi:uncharacterized Zn finger protein
MSEGTMKWQCSGCGAGKESLEAEMVPEAGEGFFCFRCRDCGTLGDPTDVLSGFGIIIHETPSGN